MVAIPRRTFAHFEAFTCYNSPYVAHDDARAIDLYPGGTTAPSPVAGEVVAIHRVRAPPKPYADPHDVVIAIDTGRSETPIETATGEAAIARILHVDPAISVGDRVAIGDDLGSLIRAGFFAPWVDNHLHLGFRPPLADPIRAGGSLPVTFGLTVHPLAWDGSGRVVDIGETYVVLDRPTDRSLDDDAWVAIASDDGDALDGGLPHYDRGGLLRQVRGNAPSSGHPVRLLGTHIGTTTARGLTWTEVCVTINGDASTGLSLYAARARNFGAKIICPDHDHYIDEMVTITVEKSA